MTPPVPMRVAAHALAGLMLAFLVLPILAVVPASFNPVSHLHPAAGLGTLVQRLLPRHRVADVARDERPGGGPGDDAPLVLGALAALGLERLGGRRRHASPGSSSRR